VKAVNQLVGAPVESHVLLQCIVEAFPKPLNTWYRLEGELTLLPNSPFFHPALSFFSIFQNDLNFSTFFLLSLLNSI
jgi:hypothetical protein